MKKTTSTALIIISALILISFTSGFSYWLGKKSIEEKFITSELLESKLIPNWTAEITGKVLEITRYTLTLEGEEENLTIPAREEVIVQRVSIEKEEKQVEEINFKDIKTGETVRVKIGIDQTGKIWAISVIVFSK